MSQYEEHPQFTAIAPHYDALMRGVPYRQWVRYLNQILRNRGAKPWNVLDLACGTGTVAEILAQQGFDVTGVDISSQMIDSARQKAAKRGLEIRYEVGDAAKMKLGGLPFGLCVSLFDSLNYVTEPLKLSMAMERVYAHLEPGGLFIFDVNSEFALVNSFFDQDNLYSNDRLRYVWRSAYDSDSRLCSIQMRFFLRHRDGVDREFRETHIQFAYRADELQSMLEGAGFTEIESFHAYTFRPVSSTTDRIFFVARKPF